METTVDLSNMRKEYVIFHKSMDLLISSMLNNKLFFYAVKSINIKRDFVKN